jgi:hypothetical protein
MWKKLAMKNSWLAIVNKPATIAVQCSRVREDVKLVETSVLRINSGCLIKTKGSILRGEEVSNINVQTTYTKPLIMEPKINTDTLQNNYTIEEPILELNDPYVEMEKKPVVLHSTHPHITNHAISSTASIVLIMVLQARLWTEMKVSVHIKQELPGRVETHQLQRLGIKESFENTEILRYFRSFAAITGTSGRIMD